jgi:hypothetical protein
MKAKTIVCIEKYLVKNAIFENQFLKMKTNLLVLLVCIISGTNSFTQVTSNIQAINQISSLSFKADTFVQSTISYKGKVVKRRGTCKWLILITETNDSAFLGKLIEPTGDFPKVLLKRGTRIRFEMTPLRQPVPEGCKAHYVASIGNIIKD